MTSDKPYFRFNPNAYEAGRSLERSTEICDVCKRQCEWKYTGNIYGLQRPTVCTNCIADGNLSRFLGDEYFALHDIELAEADADLERELLERTPGVACYNPFEWPVLDSKPLQFVGYGEEKWVLKDRDAQIAIKHAFGELDVEYELATPTSYALVFKEIDGDRYVSVIDPD